MKDLIVSGYKITTKVKTGEYPAELGKQIPELVRQCQDRKNKTIIPKLEKLIQKYPQVPTLKNLLMAAYFTKGLPRKANELNQQLLKDHPDYLYAKLNEADRLMEEKEFDKVPELLGKQMELKALYPEKEEFHIADVLSFLDTATRYFALTGDLEQARVRLEIMQKIAPDDERTELLEEVISKLQLVKGLERIQNFGKDKIEPERPWKDLPEQIITPPAFHHAEVAELYNHDFRIPEAKLLRILDLPRETLIEDLLTLIQDGLNRFEFFEVEDTEEEFDFVIHALLLLGEIKATAALPEITAFLEYDDEILELWLGDHLTETLWRVFYQLGENDPAVLQDLMLNPQVNTYGRTQTAAALAQLALQQPEKREAVVTVFKNVFQAILNAPEGSNLINTEFIGLTVWSASDARLHELLPEIQQLCEKKYMLPHFIGTYPEIEEIFSSEPDRKDKKELLPLPQFYRQIVSSWYAYQQPAPLAKTPNFLKPAATPDKSMSQFAKAGRNDPCPCGSGKKFKKCCGA